jgi:hypothetical protein
MDTADHEHVVLQLNFADRFRHQSLVRGVYLTRLQRASEGSSQSTRRRGDNVIQGCGVGLQDRRRNLVMLCYGAMHSEYYGQLGIPLTQPTTTCRFWLWRIIRGRFRSLRIVFRPKRAAGPTW